MAKPLKKPQPRSSVERFFNHTAMEAALEHHEEELTEPPVEELEEAITGSSMPKAEQQTAPTFAPAKHARVGRVVGEIGAIRTPVTPAAASRGEAINRKREFRLTKSADDALEDLVVLFKNATGAELTRSHVLRAVAKAIGEAMPSLRREAEKIGPLKRPSNARGHEDRRDEFEAEITGAFKRGMRG